MTDETTLSDPSAVTDETTPPEAPEAGEAPLTPEQKEAAAIEKRKAYSKARREKIRQEQEAAGLVLRREYTTADGATFTNKSEAAAHIAKLNFREYVEANPFNPIVAGVGEVVIPADALAAWIVENREHVLPFLRGIGKPAKAD